MLTAIGKCAVMVLNIHCYMYTAEVYGTRIRTTGTGYQCSVSRIGVIILPIIIIPLVKNNPFLPYSIYGCISLIASGLCYYLPKLEFSKVLFHEKSQNRKFLPQYPTKSSELPNKICKGTNLLRRGLK